MECVVLWIGELVHLLRHDHCFFRYEQLCNSTPTVCCVCFSVCVIVPCNVLRCVIACVVVSCNVLQCVIVCVS